MNVLETRVCTCDPVPVRSSLERKRGARLVDVRTDRGWWHAIRLATGDLRLQAIIAPSAAEQARMQERHTQAQAEKQAMNAREVRRAELLNKLQRGVATSAEQQEALVIALGGEA